MTSPTPLSSAPEPKVESFLDWFRINSRLVTAGAAVVVAVAFGLWYYNKSGALKLENADKRLLAAKQSLGSGNIPLAQTDLQRVADQYAGTPAGAEAAMLLAQVKLDQDDFKGAEALLKNLVEKHGKGPYSTPMRTLLGDAQAQLGKHAEAAAEYERAGLSTTMPNERAMLLAKIGRAFEAAGQPAKARQAWESLANQQDNPALAAEARVRLGELLATGAKS